MFRVYTTAPKTKPTGEVATNAEGEETRLERVVHWPMLGTVDAADEREALAVAKAKWGGSPVLERMGLLH